jgi:hypothetical protein
MGAIIGKNAGNVFSSGTKQVLLVTFNAKAGWVGATAVTFGSAPAGESVSDVNAQPRPANWQNGQVECGLEGDVNLAGVVNATDWTKIGRIVVGLDPMPTGMAYQAADCAPRSTLGSGGPINATDWTQCGRYVVGLDPPTPIGGPSSPSSGTSQAQPQAKTGQ